MACDDSSERWENKNSDYAARLFDFGISKEKIFIVPVTVYKAELPILNGEEISSLCKNLLNVRPVMRYIEYHVTDFCNLKCKGCSHMSNYVSELKISDPKEFRACLEKLREKFENISVIRIMGGEPLLAKNLHEFINAAHEIFPYSQISLVTNGILYKKITPIMIQAIRNAGADISISQYPPTQKIAGDIIAFCNENGLKLNLGSPIKEFSRRVISDKNTDIKTIWSNCGNTYCRFLHGTTLYPCPIVWTHNDKQFSGIIEKETAITESECAEFSYDLSKNIDADGWDILAKIDRPMRICKKCGDKIVFFKWESEAGIN